MQTDSGRRVITLPTVPSLEDEAFYQPDEHPHRGYAFQPGGHSNRGCGSALNSRLAQNYIFAKRKDALIYVGGCGTGYSGVGDRAGLGMHHSTLTGVEMAQRLRGIDRPLVVITGEGQLFEHAFDSFAAAFSRQQQITTIVVDNEGYASSGNHFTPTTLPGARMAMCLDGKAGWPRQVALMMMFGGAKYVATAVPFYTDDYRRKVEIALEKRPSLVQVLSPCVTNWGNEPEDTLKLCKIAVATGLFPVWEYDEGKFRRTIRPPTKLPVNHYVRLQRRFRGLAEEQLADLQAYADDLWNKIDKLELAFA